MKGSMDIGGHEPVRLDSEHRHYDSGEVSVRVRRGMLARKKIEMLREEKYLKKQLDDVLAVFDE